MILAAAEEDPKKDDPDGWVDLYNAGSADLQPSAPSRTPPPPHGAPPPYPGKPFGL